MARTKLVQLDVSNTADDPDRSAVKSLRKALTVLNTVANADRPLTVAEVAINAGIARPTAYRFVQTLVASGYLTQDPADGRLSVGFAVLPLASSLLDRNRMRIAALPHLQSLAQQTGERANLGILYRDRVMYVAGVEKPALPTIYSRFGKSAPAHCSSLGKAILAFQSETEVHALLSRKPLIAFTPTTITGHAAFTKELAETRARLRDRPRRARAWFQLRRRADLRCEPSADRRHRRERPRPRSADQAPGAGASHGRSHIPPPAVIELPSQKAKPEPSWKS